MTGTNVDGRRLRFDLTLAEDESIPGALARAVGDHRLGTAYPALASAGLGRLKPGLTQLLPDAELRRLAHVIRCDAKDLIGRAGVRILGDKGAKVGLQHVRLGDLVLMRSHLDLLNRRIAPLTLRDGAYHRADWLNVLLPFCPSSLERLVDACPACRERLGWNRAVGIGRCEHCAEEVPPAPEPPLAKELADDYRLFAGLASTRADVRAAAVARLPARLQAFAPGDLVRIALRCGLARTPARPAE